MSHFEKIVDKASGKVSYRLVIDVHLLADIEQFLALHAEQEELEADSDRWQELEGDMDQQLFNIAWSIVWDFKYFRS